MRRTHDTTILRLLAVGAAVLALGACAGDDDDNGGADTGVGGDASDVANVPTCQYPTDYEYILAEGTKAPPLAWTTARDENGNIMDFSFEDFHCNDDAWGDYNSLIVIVSAGWCPNCPDYIRSVDAIEGELEALGARVVYVEAETDDFTSPTGAQANAHINTILRNSGGGIRISDGESLPTPRSIFWLAGIQAFPSAFVIRRDDMRVIADQFEARAPLDFEAVVAGVADADPIAPRLPSCGPSDEEAADWSNNDPMSATVLNPGEAVEGAICNYSGDFYKLGGTGDVRVELSYDSKDAGNIFLLVLWDDEAQDLYRNAEGYLVGSGSGEGPETVELPAGSTVLVFPRTDQRSSGEYSIVVTQL